MIIGAAVNYFQSPLFYTPVIILFVIGIFIISHEFIYGFGYLKITNDHFIFYPNGIFTPIITHRAIFRMDQKLTIKYYLEDKSIRCIQDNHERDVNLNGLNDKHREQLIVILKNICSQKQCKFMIVDASTTK